MKTKLLLSLVSIFLFGNMAMTQCQAFMQYTLGLCPQVQFFDGSTSGSGTIVAWSWDFGDGNTSSAQNPSNTYAANGTYLVCLTITTSTFCVDTYCDTITVNCITPPGCNADFQYTLGACPTVSFFDGSTSSPGTIASWAWDFGDGSTSTLQNPSHTYSANGSYITCLTITTTDACTSTYCDTIIVNCITPPGCNADFVYTIGACPTIFFADNSSSSPGTITSWSWDFGDGASSTTQSPSHTYSANGTYLTCLSITTSDSCTSTYCDTIVINCISPPACQAAFQYTLGACPSISFFDGSTSSPGSIVSWSWDFGDGSTSNAQNPSHTYAADGSYITCLTIITDDSCTSTYCDTVSINCIGGSSSCQAGFQYTLGACPTISFFDGSTGSPGVVSEWVWDFGDGSTSTLQNPSHTYIADGSYTVCLSITTTDSCTSTYCDTISINCVGGVSCDANFAYSDSCPTFCFSDNSTHTGSITGWNWDFGDGNTANTNGPCHTYAADGAYVVCYSITTSDSCTSTVCDTIIVNCTVGINDLDDNSIQMYPNPVSDELTLSLDPRMPLQAIDLRDSRGRLINAINLALFNNGVYTMNVNELPSGLYFITVNNGQATKAYRFVKQ